MQNPFGGEKIKLIASGSKVCAVLYEFAFPIVKKLCLAQVKDFYKVVGSWGIEISMIS